MDFEGNSRQAFIFVEFKKVLREAQKLWKVS